MPVPLHAQGLPSGYGWHVLPNTQMSSVCLGNVSNGMYTDSTMTTTTNYNFGCNEVTPWSGGAIDDAHQRLIVWGGGHSDYAGDEVLVLNLSGTPSWELFTKPTTPVPFVGDGKNWEGLNPYYVRLADGGTYKAGATPASRHTYNGLQYVPYQNKLYAFGGAVANIGFFSSEVWTLDMASKSWTMVGPPYSKSPVYPTSAYNPSNGHIIMHDKSWTLLDYDPRANVWTTLNNSYHVEDGTTAAVDPVNNLLVVVGSAGTTDNTSYPSVPTTHTVQVFSLSAPYTMQSWSGAGCDLTYRSGGLAWDSALGLMVGYPGGGNQVYLLNTGSSTVETPFGSVPSHQCLDVPISPKPSPIKEVDYPQDPEGSQSDSNFGVYGRFEYVPSLDVFIVVNSHTQNAWILRLGGGSPEPDYTLSASTSSLSVVAGGTPATGTLTTKVSGGFNNYVALTAAGAPTGLSINFSPSTITAPGAGASTFTVSASPLTPIGTYPIAISGFGGGDTHVAMLSVTVTSNNQPTLSVAAAPSSVTVAQGSYGSSTITTTIGGSFNNAVSLSASGVPFGTTVAFNPNGIPAPGGGTSAMTISVGSTTPIGTYPITVTASGGGLAPTTTVSLTVTAQQGPSLTVSAVPSALSLAPGTQGSVSVTTTVGGGFNSAVSLSATGVPTGTTLSFNPSVIPAPGSGTSSATIQVGSTTALGIYPITITAAGNGLTARATVTLSVVTAPTFQQGFNFRATAGYVSDPANTTHVLGTTAYPTKVGTITFGWQRTSMVQSRDRSKSGDPRLAGVNYVLNGTPARFQVDLPAAGTYTVSLAMGDGGYSQCWTRCQVQFLDGSTDLGTVSGSMIEAGYFYDDAANAWSATTWPGSNVTKQITMTGTRLTVVVGTNASTGDNSPISFLGISQGKGSSSDFTVTASPSTLSVAQGNQGSSSITTSLIGSFNSSISLSASGVPSGTSVSFNPSTIPSPGAGTSAMTISVGANTATGSYPITVTATGSGTQHTTTVTLTVTAQSGLTVSANPSSLSLQQGTQGTSTVTTTVQGNFNSQVGLSATGVPSGTTISLTPTTIPAAGAGTAVMTISVGANTTPGTYPITVMGSGGGIQKSATVTLTVTQQLTFQQGFNFRATAGYVSDPANTTHVLATTAYPTKVGTVTFGWQKTSMVQSRDRSKTMDPRLAGLNYVPNGTPARFQVDLPAAGTYTVSLAMGDGGYSQCWTRCQVQFLDGNTVLGTVSGSMIGAGYFYDDAANAWSATTWPGSNVTKQITMTGTRLTVVVGTNASTGDNSPISFLGISQGKGSSSDFTVTASPSTLSVAQGHQGSSSITTSLIGSFNSSISLSASGVPSGTSVSFNPSTIPAPGAGTSAMTISVGANTAPGSYPITVTATGSGIQHTTTVTLTVTTTQSGLTVSANPSSLSLQQGTQGTSTVTTTVQGNFNSQVALSASGVPLGTTIGFNPQTIPGPGAGSSTMTIAVAATTPTGTYPITVTATGGGLAPTTTVSLTVTPSGGGSGNGITVADLSGHGQSNRPVSIGRFFKQGDIPQFAQAVMGNNPLLTQCDVKNRWPDGSLKFAIISFVLPTVSTGGTSVTFQNQSTGNNTGYLQMSDMLDSSYDFDAVMRLSGNVNSSISARAMLQGASFRYWLQGPVVTAVIVEDRDGRSYDVNSDGQAGNPLHPIFEAWFYPQGKKVEVGFTLENVWSSSDSSKSARNQTFGLTLTTGNASPATRLTQPTFTEWAFSRWRRAFWIGSDPLPVQFNWNPRYLVTTGGYPAYDVNYLPNSSVVNAEYATYNNIATKYPARLTIAGLDDPSHGGIVNYDQAINATGDPTSGSWIGLFPTWDIDYLLTGDPRLQKQMTDNADLAGRFPMWFREADHNAGSGAYFDYPHSGTVDPYGHVVSINARQQVTLMLTDWHPGCSGEAPDNINAGAPLTYGGWPALDTSHLPDFGFVPYTLTGKYYYLEQEEMEAGYAAGFRTGCYGPSNNYWRQGYLGMLELLLRDQAWAMRTLAYGSFLAPDGDPEGPYFKDKVLNNIARMEGEHGLTLDITDTSDRSVAYQWGYNTAIYGQASNPSPLGAWQVDSAAYDYAQNGSVNNVNPSTLKAAGSMFMEAFMNVSLGMTRQLGIGNTKALLTFAAKRPFHVLLDSGVNHYLIGQYCYPSQYKDGSWVADWSNFQANYLVLPSQWGSPGTTDDARGFQQMSGISFMTDITSDGINGQAVWNWFKANKPNQSEFQTVDPRWSITPFH